MISLRARGLISTFNRWRTETGTRKTPVDRPNQNVHGEDGRLHWYAEAGSNPFQAELEQERKQHFAKKMAIAQAARRDTQPGCRHGQSKPGVTPEAGLDILKRRPAKSNSTDESATSRAKITLPPGVAEQLNLRPIASRLSQSLRGPIELHRIANADENDEH